MPKIKKINRDVFFMLAFLILGLIIVAFASFQGTDVAKLQGAVINTSIQHTLGVKTIGSGTVASLPAGINCGKVCKAQFSKNTVIILTPTPLPGYEFDKWTGNCSGTGQCTITMSSSRSVVAKFRAIPSLRIYKSGTGKGVVTSNPVGIICGDSCKAPFAYNSTVTLLATPEPGSVFSSWSGCPNSKIPTCDVKMTTSKTVSARFTKSNIVTSGYILQTVVSGSGIITGQGIDCGSDCTETYDSTSTVLLTANPSETHLFNGWFGACSGKELTCLISIDSSKQVIASFVADEPIGVQSGYSMLNIATVPPPTTPLPGKIIMGSNDNTFLVLSFSAGEQSVNVSRIAITDYSLSSTDLNNLKLFSIGTGSSVPVQIGSTVLSFYNATNGKAVVNIEKPWLIPANTTQYLVIKAGVNEFPNAISGSSHVLKIVSDEDIDSYDASSGSSVKETGLPVASETQYVYRTNILVKKDSGSPAGISVSGLNKEILRFGINTDSNYSANIGAIGLTLNGNVNINGFGDASLYKVDSSGTNLVKTEKSKQAICLDKEGTTLTVDDATGIPVGSNIVLYGNVREVKKIIAIEDMAHITIDSPTSLICSGTSSSILYFPLQPGSGKLYFGAMTRLISNVSDTDNQAQVSSINGFAIGDSVTFKGYNSDSQETMITAKISGLSGNKIYFKEASANNSSNSTIIADRLNSSEGFNFARHIGKAVAYEGTDSNTSIGHTTTAGASFTYLVKGDTTGASANNTLKAIIELPSDFIWSDYLSYIIDSHTNIFPLDGGTLTY